MTVHEIKRKAVSELSSSSQSPSLDAEILLCFILNFSKTDLLLHSKDEISDEKAAVFLNLIQKRKTGLPVAYLTNQKEFYGYSFFVTPDVLIPKPDTEILVENAVNTIYKTAIKSEKKLEICDMCTGSGCIGISVFLELKKLLPVEKMPNFTLADISPAALKIAKKNLNLLCSDISNFSLIQSDLFSSVSGSFDFILTNPPYIPSKMVDELLKDGRNEPRLALNGFGEDGLGLIRKLIPQIKEKLTENGVFYMETGEYNAEDAAIFSENNDFKDVMILKDLEGQLRVIFGTKITAC